MLHKNPPKFHNICIYSYSYYSKKRSYKVIWEMNIEIGVTSRLWVQIFRKHNVLILINNIYNEIRVTRKSWIQISRKHNVPILINNIYNGAAEMQIRYNLHTQEMKYEMRELKILLLHTRSTFSFLISSRLIPPMLLPEQRGAG